MFSFPVRVIYNISYLAEALHSALYDKLHLSYVIQLGGKDVVDLYESGGKQYSN
jgi:hypothetical protein